MSFCGEVYYTVSQSRRVHYRIFHCIPLCHRYSNCCLFSTATTEVPTYTPTSSQNRQSSNDNIPKQATTQAQPDIAVPQTSFTSGVQTAQKMTTSTDYHRSTNRLNLRGLLQWNLEMWACLGPLVVLFEGLINILIGQLGL